MGQDSECGREDHGQDSRTASGQVVSRPPSADASPAPAPVSAPRDIRALAHPVKFMPPRRRPPPPRHHEQRRPEQPAVECGLHWLRRGPGVDERTANTRGETDEGTAMARDDVDVQGGDETDEGTAKARELRPNVIRRRVREKSTASGQVFAHDLSNVLSAAYVNGIGAGQGVC